MSGDTSSHRGDRVSPLVDRRRTDGFVFGPFVGIRRTESRTDPVSQSHGELWTEDSCESGKGGLGVTAEEYESVAGYVDLGTSVEGRQMDSNETQGRSTVSSVKSLQ